MSLSVRIIPNLDSKYRPITDLQTNHSAAADTWQHTRLTIPINIFVESSMCVTVQPEYSVQVKYYD